ncbi:hypothetical protein GCM10028784_36240 [Myceligenerans cantabricum]
MRASHVITAAAAALLLAALVAARADLGSEPGPSASAPSASSTGTPTPAPDAPASPRAPEEQRTVTAAGVEVEITAAEIRVGGPGDDGTRRITVSGSPAYSTATAGADLVEHGDGSVTVLRDDAPVAALTPAQDGRDGGGGAGPDARSLVLGERALGSATWARREGEGGLSLAVVPEPWVRGGGESTLDLLAAQLATAEPETDSDTMRDQLACHHLGAPDKASWNLEPWRPDVGAIGTIAARCNPTDS